jgi:hypothetical protein
MKLKLTVEVPSSADQDEVLLRLLTSRDSGTGVTITAFAGYQVDVDLVDIERVVLQEVQA